MRLSNSLSSGPTALPLNRERQRRSAGCSGVLYGLRGECAALRYPMTLLCSPSRLLPVRNQQVFSSAFWTRCKQRVILSLGHSEQSYTATTTRAFRAFNERVTTRALLERAAVFNDAQYAKKPSTQLRMFRWNFSIRIQPVPGINDQHESTYITDG